MFDGMTSTKVPEKYSGKEMFFIAFDEISKLGPVTKTVPEYFVKMKQINYLHKPPCQCKRCKAQEEMASKLVECMQERMLNELWGRRRVETEPIKAYELLKEPRSWTQHQLEVYRDGWTQRCLMGALFHKWRSTMSSGYEARAHADADKVAKVLASKYGVRYLGIDAARVVATWNDQPGTRHSTVLEVLKEADV